MKNYTWTQSVLALSLIGATFGASFARAGECTTLDQMRLNKLKAQNEARLEGFIAKQSAQRLLELKTKESDLETYRWWEIGTGVAALGVTYAVSFNNAKQAGRYYDNGFRMMKDVFMKSPTFGLFAVGGAFEVVHGSLSLYFHYSNIDRLEAELAARATVLFEKDARVEEEITKLKQAMQKAGCTIPENELVNDIRADDLVVSILQGKPIEPPKVEEPETYEEY